MSTQPVPQPDAGQFQYVKLPDGSYWKFAANAGDDVIKSAISKDFPTAFATPTQQAANRFVDPGNTSMSAGTQTFEQAHPNLAPKSPGIMSRFASGAGIPTSQYETTEAMRGTFTPKADPNEQSKLVRGLEQVPVLGGDFRARADLSKRADQEGGTGVGVAHRIASWIPLVGPAVTAAQDKYDQGDYAGAAGAGLTALFSMEGLKGAVAPKPNVATAPSLGQLTDDAAARHPLTPPKPVMPLKTTVVNALDKGTDALANTLTDPRKTFTETIPRAAGRAVRRMVGQPPAEPIALEKPPVTFTDVPDLRVMPAQQPPQNLLDTQHSAAFQVVPPEAGTNYDLFPESGTIDPFAPQSLSVNDPRGAFAKYAQEQDLGGLADPLAAQNTSPITNPIKPPSTLPNWASEVTDWEQNDPRHLFNMQDEHGFLNHLRQEEIQQWMAEHDKQPEPFASSGLKTREKGPGLMRNAAETKAAGPTPQVPTEANTQDLLLQSIEQANAKKARTVGQPPGTQVSAAQPAAVNGGVSVSAPTTGDEIINIRPQDFIDRTGTSARDMNPESIAQAKEAYSSGQQVEPPEIHFDQDGNVVGADGRHRAMGAAQAGVDRIPVRVKRIGGEAPTSGAGLTPDNPVSMSAIPRGGSGTVKTSELSLDPARFQYKTNTDESGVTNQFKDTKTFSRPLAGVTSVWTDPADGKTYVVNGHHRVELANRTGEPTMLIQHLEASSAKNARAQGAIINIAEGRGTAVDAAKFIRDSGMQPGDLSKLGVTPSESKISDGLALSKLDQPLFDKVATGQMPEQRGIAIGQATADPVQQRAIVDLIDKQEAKGRKINNDTVAELGRFVANSGNKTIEQGGLFGPNQQISSLALDKAELSAAVRNGFTKEKAVYGSVSSADKAKTLAAVEGQTIQPEKNAAISQEAGQALELYDKLSVTKGPINDILESVAKDKANGYISAEEAKRTALERIRAEIRKTLGSGPGGSGTGSQTRPGFPAPPK